MNAEINKEFVFSYLSGKTSALQKQMIDEWVKIPANEELFYKWLVEYEYQHPQYLTELPNAVARFQDFADKFDENPAFEFLVQEKSLPIKRLTWVWMVAASFVLGILMSGWIFKDSFLYQIHSTAFGETKSLYLSDSTKVTLNANSSLRVPRFGFGAKTREVLLTGEANFAVTHQPTNQKFVVKTGKGLEVVVLGTEFTVYSRQRGSKVVLNKGKVQLRYQEGQTQKQLMMKPGDLVTFDQSNHLNREVTKQPEKYAAWKDHRFVFDDTTLQEFAKIMDENYGIKVIIRDEALAKRTLVGSFQADNADELLNIVSEIFTIKITKIGDTVVLTDYQ
ncbi:FecR domain-containing protein [Runella sp.]|jgi:ferric-dicitrate binding protein FerR (iron transport regulator)|uniref:FecR family protein n=1 Tax=Runella sp. TaxID=1960881 RepID=UPI002605C2EA|nr:FecR domain-containing protein [Runella sp.]